MVIARRQTKRAVAAEAGALVAAEAGAFVVIQLDGFVTSLLALTA